MPAAGPLGGLPAAAALGLRLVTLLEFLGHAGTAAGRSAFVALAVAEAVTLLIAAVTLAARAARALRRLPDEQVRLTA